MVFSTSLNFINYYVSGGLWENLWIIFHIFFSVFISSSKHEFETDEETGRSNNEIFFLIVSVGNWVDLLLSFHETSSNSSGVFVTYLIDLDGVITAVEWNDKSSSLIIWFCADKNGIKSKSVHILLEHFFHINLWWLGFKSKNWTKGVFWRTITVIGWDSLESNVWSWFSKLEWGLLNTHVLLIPFMSEFITVVYQAFSSVNCQFISTH